MRDLKAVEAEEKKAVPALTPEQQGQLQHALLTQQAAQARAAQAEAELRALAFRFMAECGVSPSEYDVGQGPDGFGFVRRQVLQSASPASLAASTPDKD